MKRRVRGKAKKGFLVVISGPSGVGKSTVVQRLVQVAPSLVVSISATTRPPRSYETQGIDYNFLTEQDFFGRQRQGEFLEYAQVHGYYYATPKAPIEKLLAAGKTVVLEVDVQGATHVKHVLEQGKIKSQANVFIFLIPPSVDILAFRLKKRRTEDEEAVNYRLRAAVAELQVMEKYDYIVVNDQVDTAAQKIHAIIQVERERALLN